MLSLLHNVRLKFDSGRPSQKKSDKFTSHHPSTASFSDVTSLTWLEIVHRGYTVAATSTKSYTTAYF
jgi:hypothetical protein